MKQHSAYKAGAKILRKAGFNLSQAGTLSFRVLTDTYNDQPLFVDLELSRHDNAARFRVCWLSENHSEYNNARAFDGIEFDYE